MTREMRAVSAGLLLLGALFLGAQPALAAPPPPIEATAEARPTGPTDLAPPTGVNPPTTTTTTTTAQPPPPADTTTSTTTKKPAKPPKPVKAAKPAAPPPVTTTTAPPTTEPTSIPTPNRIDTGGGANSVPGPPTVLFWVVPGLAVLTLAAGVSGYWLARSEQDRR